MDKEEKSRLLLIAAHLLEAAAHLQMVDKPDNQRVLDGLIIGAKAFLDDIILAPQAG